MAISVTLTKEEAKRCKFSITNNTTGKESYYYFYKGLVLKTIQVIIKDK